MKRMVPLECSFESAYCSAAVLKGPHNCDFLRKQDAEDWRKRWMGEQQDPMARSGTLPTSNLLKVTVLNLSKVPTSPISTRQTDFFMGKAIRNTQ